MVIDDLDACIEKMFRANVIGATSEGINWKVEALELPEWKMGIDWAKEGNDRFYDIDNRRFEEARKEQI